MPVETVFQMKGMKKLAYILPCLLLSLFQSCRESGQERMERLLKQWHGKEILFPGSPTFTVYGEDTVEMPIPDGNYKIVHYLDSVGCTSCRIDLVKWKGFIGFLDSVTGHSVPCLFFIHAKGKREVKMTLKEHRFDHPVCLDMENEFNRLNGLPQNAVFQTLLLDKGNKVVAMGDPVKNPRVKELYLNILSGRKTRTEMDRTRTTAELSHSTVDLGTFHWEERRDTAVTLVNTGTKPLVIHDIVTSCGCTVADYDKRPAQPGEGILISTSYMAEHPEHFNKTVVVYCNAEQSPFVLRMTGNAVR